LAAAQLRRKDGGTSTPARLSGYRRDFLFAKSWLIRKGFPDYPVKNIEFADVIKGLPIQRNTADAVYCSHVLEHLTLSEFRQTIRNVFDYLKPGDRFRLVLPDLEFLIKQYSASDSSNACSTFLEAASLGETGTRGGLKGMAKGMFGRSRHLWMWDYKGMSRELADAGFINIRRAYFNDSEEPRFAEVEHAGRWENCLGVECRKPA
jgi:SAM-dependent methyltransferase